MKKDYAMTFYKADFLQYCTILENEEIRKDVSDFLLRYVSLEAMYKKMLIAYKEEVKGRKLTKKEKDLLGVDLNDVKRLFNHFNILADSELVERVFGSNDKSYMDCSIKKLRNRLVHNVNENVLRVILERYDSIHEDLDALEKALTR